MRMKVAQQENKKHVVARTQAPPQSMSTTRAGPPNETAALLNWQQTQGNHFLQRRLNARLARLFSGGGGPQAQLTVGPPNDRFEQEADHVARRVVAGERVARIPRLAAGGLQPTTDLESAINRARGSGQPLEAGLQRSMGQAMGADFSGVKVHTDAQSDQLNQAIQAKAFTTGQDVFFRQGEYNPGSRGGQGLIAHELTHVVQQNGGAVQRSLLNSPQQSPASVSNEESKKRKQSKKRKREGVGEELPINEELPNKRVTRSSGKIFDLNRPRLEFSSSYKGVANQKLNARQRISFDQNATLLKPDNAPLNTASYYDFRQKVRDSFESYPRNTGHALGQNFVQDGPFRPPYENENIQSTQASINFHDNPGFSGDRQIPIDSWLNWYEVRFQWKVKRSGGANEWTSPEVRHRVDSPYDAGQDVAVVHVSTPNDGWDVVIPEGS